MRVFYLRLRRRIEDGSCGEFLEVEGVVLELGAAEVEEQCVGDAGRPHVMDDLRPFNLRDGLDGLQLNDVAAVEAGEVGSPVRRQGLSVVIDPHVVFADIRDARLLEFDFERVPVCGFEKSVAEDAVHTHGASHDRIGLWIVFENHARIIPHPSASKMPT